MIKNYTKLFLLLILIIFIIFIFNFNKNIEKVCFNENCFNVEIAETKEERAKGLMFRENLEKNKGMLFIFEKEDIYPFWMKNTLMPLDIIWINKDRKVVFISEDTQPCKAIQCPVINPNKKALYALEINSGISNKTNLNEGDKLTFY